MIADHAYTPDLDALLDGQPAGPAAAGEPVDRRGRMPQLPDDDESRAWVLNVCEGKTQADVAQLMGKTQGGVSRLVARATSKIDDLVRLRWISREQLERNIRRAVGLAAHT